MGTSFARGVFFVRQSERPLDAVMSVPRPSAPNGEQKLPARIANILTLCEVLQIDLDVRWLGSKCTLVPHQRSSPKHGRYTETCHGPRKVRLS